MNGIKIIKSGKFSIKSYAEAFLLDSHNILVYGEVLIITFTQTNILLLSGLL